MLANLAPRQKERSFFKLFFFKEFLDPINLGLGQVNNGLYVANQLRCHPWLTVEITANTLRLYEVLKKK
ncbi:MAG: hypothetical protein SFV55_14930 [Haliscomenobacter sp.]|uniref:hypothetical protein n=1 Tax=Haliscomenobacter sp. TaxID=2717303 RepID=UPI0029A14C67|nr:hypothetical protein [Haliscomenobacter sp.]MDX2069720.1 hypothetical protein [Haliscomenobacter sp.]